MTAEIGIMRITEQIDALDTMADQSAAISDCAETGGRPDRRPSARGDLRCGGDLRRLTLSEWTCWASTKGPTGIRSKSAVEWKDVYGGILKSISFGLIISWVCCYKGFYTKQSAEGLGTATTEAVVLSSVLILVWDYFLTSLLL